MTAWMRLCRGAAVLAVGLGVALPPAAASADEMLSSTARGGRLYDNWWRELDERPPVERHPLYPIGGLLASDTPRAWRCVECHGWDYKGKDGQFGQGERYTGIIGITGAAGSDPARVLKVMRDEKHGYGDLMDPEDLQDLANFVAHGQTPLMDRIDPATGRVAADGGAASDIYRTVCAACHGENGQQMASIPALGDFARSDPWQTLHNILNGHAGGAMPSMRALDDGVVLSLLAYMQSLPEVSLVGSVTRGGRLYANWQRETGREPPPGKHPAYPRAVGDASEERGTWNCRECHGWDYLGKDGAFATGRHATGIKGITGMKDGEPAKVAKLLTDKTHRYDLVLTSRDLADLANFVALGQVDMGQVVDRRTARITGDAKTYEAHFQTMCATCHGPLGKKVRTMPPLGRVVTEQPERAVHSVLNGHPGEFMPPLRAFSMDMVAGILAFAQTLPQKK